jgi:hypothetical protein
MGLPSPWRSREGGSDPNDPTPAPNVTEAPTSRGTVNARTHNVRVSCSVDCGTSSPPSARRVSLAHRHTRHGGGNSQEQDHIAIVVRSERERREHYRQGTSEQRHAKGKPMTDYAEIDRGHVGILDRQLGAERRAQPRGLPRLMVGCTVSGHGERDEQRHWREIGEESAE